MPGRESTGAGGGLLSTVLDLDGGVYEVTQPIFGSAGNTSWPQHARVLASAQPKLTSLPPSESTSLVHDKFVGGTVIEEDAPRAMSTGSGPRKCGSRAAVEAVGMWRPCDSPLCLELSEALLAPGVCIWSAEGLVFGTPPGDSCGLEGGVALV